MRDIKDDDAFLERLSNMLNEIDKTGDTIGIGDIVRCSNGVSGKVIKKYVPTASAPQIMVRTYDGRDYHAPAMTDWIPCSERLPEKCEDELVYLSSARITVMQYNRHKLPFNDYCIGWGHGVDYDVDFQKESVVAWMPLPEPYKGE